MWNTFATDAFKLHFILKAENDLNQKMEYLLSATGKKVSDYCPALEELLKNRQTMSLKEIYEHSINLTEKHIVPLSGFDVFHMEPNCYDPLLKQGMEYSQKENPTEEQIQCINTNLEMVNQRKNDIYGKGFLSFRCEENGGMSPIFCDGKVAACMVTDMKRWNWECEGICYFPIELFNVKIQGVNKEVFRIEKAKDCCISLRGKLIEFIVIDQEWSWTTYRPIDTDDGRKYEFSPVTTRDPTPEQLFLSHFPKRFYIPQLDA